MWTINRQLIDVAPGFLHSSVCTGSGTIPAGVKYRFWSSNFWIVSLLAISRITCVAQAPKVEPVDIDSRISFSPDGKQFAFISSITKPTIAAR